MKSTILITIFSLFIGFGFAQTDLETLVGEGIAYHDAGQYKEAIQTYKKALKLIQTLPWSIMRWHCPISTSKNTKKQLSIPARP